MAAATTTEAVVAAAWSQRVEMPTDDDDTDTDYCIESCGDDGDRMMMMRKMTPLFLRKIATLDFDLAVEAAVVATGLLAANQVCVYVHVCARALVCACVCACVVV